jgi:DNA polymerase-3 subunit epsilon
MAQLTLSRPIVFFDLETTGLNPATDRIVEMALVKMLPNGERETWVKRLNPGMPIPAETTAIHGIRDADVADAPAFRQVAKELLAWIKGCDFGGYNAARFDLPLLVEEFLRAGVPVDFTASRMVDVQKIFFKMEQRTLSAAYKFYCGKTIENAHSAEVDIMATIEVLEAQLDRYEDISHDVAGLHNFLYDEEELVDYARTMVRREGQVLFNFGKYKGQRVEDVFTQNPSHYDWMMKGDFSLHTKQKISEILNAMKLAKLRKM